MKKIFYSMFALIMALSFASCEDVPAPYDDPASGGTENGIYLEEMFTTGKGKFEIKTPKGQDWKLDHNVMTASGYNFDTKETVETETYMVSPAIDLSKSEGACISFKYINMYVTPEASFRFLISDKYTGQPETTEWKDLSIKWEESAIKDWDTYFDYNMNVPAEYIGKGNIVIAFAFNCSNVKSSTIKVKDLVVKDGVVEENPDENAEGVYINEPFSDSFGKFKVANVKGEPWIIDNYGYAKGTGHQGKDMPAIPSDSYLVSPEMDMSQSKGASITFDYVLRYVRPTGKNQVLVTDNYTGDPTTTQWVDFTGELKEVNDWKDWQKFSANIPGQFVGKNKVVIALHYTCDTESGTWEVKNLIVKEGKAEDNPGGGDINESEYLNETFSKEFGKFNVANVKGEPWIIDSYGYAKGTGHQGKDLPAIPSDSYLVSAGMDMTKSKGASISFDYVLRYVRPTGKNQVLVTDNYTGDPTTTQWVDITGKLTEVNDWKDWQKFNANIPEQFIGKNKVVVALHFTCEEESGTWEVKNLVVKEGKVEDNPGGGDKPGQDELNVGDTKTPNGDFETWVNSEPNNWFGPASKANLFYSEDAHSGKYSVQIGGNPEGNMRLGYKILNLKAGHYVMKFFVKAVTAEGGSARPGYVVLTDGKPTGGSDYKYGDYINDLKNDSWTQATYEFDIAADGEYTVVVMNAKKPGKDILVDDFTLEYNGEFIIK